MSEIKVIYPMLAGGGRTKDKWDSPSWVAEEKIDGSRYLLHITKDRNRFTSRQKSRKTKLPVEKTDNVPHLADEDWSEFAGTILDGEMRHKNFSKTVSIMGSLPENAISLQKDIGFIDYYVFDILEYKGKNVRDKPYRERRNILVRLISELKTRSWDNAHFSYIGIELHNKREFYDDIVKAGGEGVILKNLNGKYEDGKRSKDWIKVKKYITDDVVIIGATKPTKKYHGGNEDWYYLGDDGEKLSRAYFKGWIGAIRFGKYKNGKLIELGQTSGIDDGIKERLSDGNNDIKKEYIGTVMEIGAMEKIKKSGAYRHPRFLRLRNDKDAEDCTD